MFAMAGVLLGPIAANAQSWPERPVRLIVPFAPGGQTDSMSRQIGKRLADGLNQPFLIENRPGAGTVIGTDIVAKAAPDGQTFLINAAALAINASLVPKLPYDTLRDLEPVSLLYSNALILALHPTVPVKNVAEMIRFTRARPGELQFASAGVGTMGHLALELFQETTKLSYIHVPYKGSAPAITDMLGGHVYMFFDNPVSIMPHVRAGKFKAIATTGPGRMSLLPDVPTVAEQGLKGFDAINWTMLVAPAKTSGVILDRLNAEVARGMRAKDFIEQAGRDGLDVVAGSRAEAQRYLTDEVSRWGRIIRERGIKAE